jgi:periplasmic protein CpxP/Spy
MASKPRLLASGLQAHGLRHQQELSMVDQNNATPASPDGSSPASIKRGRRGTLAIALIAVALVAGVTGSLLSTAFGQGFGWRGGGWHDGPFTAAQIDDRIDRMTKHMAIELDATADQQARIAAIAKAAVGDLRPLRERAQAARAQGLALLTAPTIDRSAIERLRSEQIGLAETASKRIAQALADAADVLNPEQRKKVADWVASRGPLMRWWHHG